MGSYMSTQEDTKNKYGWKRDLHDVRDKKLTFKPYQYSQNKSMVDLRNRMPEVYNQGNIGSCTANAICSAFEFDQMDQGLPSFSPSRLFLYYNERLKEGTESIDSGASIRDGIKSINKQGICSEAEWPYQVNYFTTCPYKKCYTDAKFHKCLKYKRMDNSNIKDLKHCLSVGKPFVFGFSVYSSFENPMIWNPKVDSMPMPNPNKEKLLGGHAVMAVGYSDKRKCFIIRNSWGKDWGLDGYFFMPYQFITSNQCDDFWVVQTVVDSDKYVSKLSIERESYSNVVKNKKSTSDDEDKEKTIMIPLKEKSPDKQNCHIMD